MKRSILTIAVLFFVLLSGSLYSLDNFDYTGIAFNGSGNLLANQSVDLNIQIINSSGIQYEEDHTGVSTDQFGAYTVTVGTGTTGDENNDLSAVSASKDMKIKVTVNNSGTWVVSSFVKLNQAVHSKGVGEKTYWTVDGNSGTAAGTNFIGTTDDEELRMEVRNSGTVEQSLRLNTNQAIFRESGITGITAGNARGQYAVDMQIYRIAGTQVASGDYSTIGGGYSNTAGGDYSTIGGGNENTASGHHSSIGGGLSNRAGYFYSTVSGGRENSANYYYATIPGGYRAVADKYGQNAYASGRFSADGDAQTSLFVMRNTTTTSAGWRNLYLNGSTSLLEIPNNKTWTFKIIIVANTNGAATNGAGYEITGVVRNNGGTATILGSPIVTTLYESNSSYDARVSVSSDNLLIQVEGSGDALRWVARVEVVEVGW